MSEYQYYEFPAVDRPLTSKEMAELRALSTRALITPSRFQNVYNWGNFKSDPEAVLAHYFDAFVYDTNWGTRQLMFRLPRNSLEQASHYTVEPCLQVWSSGDHDLISFTSDDEEGGGWVDDEESESWLPSLLPLRAELIAGDCQSLYFGWLVAAQFEQLDEDVVEPPVPPGLGSLSAPLQTLAQFLQLDPDLLAVAAERSGSQPDRQPSPDVLRAWIQRLPEGRRTSGSRAWSRKSQRHCSVSNYYGVIARHTRCPRQRRMRARGAPSPSWSNRRPRVPRLGTVNGPSKRRERATSIWTHSPAARRPPGSPWRR